MASHTGYRTMAESKVQLGAVPYPKPQMDWTTIRLAKIWCEDNCLDFNSYQGGCFLKRLPSKCLIIALEDYPVTTA
jgi:hypothetical protein